MSSQSIYEKEGSIDDFIDNLVSSPPQQPNSYKLLNENETDLETTFNILVEIFTKTMKYIYSDRTGKVNLDNLDEDAYYTMSKYYNSFGFNLFIEKIEGAYIYFPFEENIIVVCGYFKKDPLNMCRIGGTLCEKMKRIEEQLNYLSINSNF